MAALATGLGGEGRRTPEAESIRRAIGKRLDRLGPEWPDDSAEGREGSHAVHATIVPRWTDASVVWFINDKPEAAQDFENWDAAVKWAEDVRAALEAEEWHGDA